MIKKSGGIPWNATCKRCIDLQEVQKCDYPHKSLNIILETGFEKSSHVILEKKNITG